MSVHTPENDADPCVCAPQWIAAGGGCMCWPQTSAIPPVTCRFGTHAPRDCPARVFAVRGSNVPACPIPPVKGES